MTTVVYLQIVSSVLGVLGSLFFAKAVISQSSKQLANLASMCADCNPEMVKALAEQKSDYIFGVVLISLAFALQSLSFFLQSAFWVIVSAIGSGLLLLVLLTIVSRFLAKNIERRINSAFLDDWKRRHNSRT